MKKTLKVAIAQDWLIGGGAERVIESLHQIYPDAPIYTSYCTDEWRQKLDSKVITGYLQHWPFSKLRKFLPLLRIRWFSSLDLSGYDLVISSSSSGEAKAVKPGANGIHVNYNHAPTHFYWLRYDEYLQHPGFGLLDPIASLGLKLLVRPLRKWDYKIMQQPDYIIANSTYTQAGIKKYYGRDSTVIFPPVDTDRFPPKDEPRVSFVVAGRQTPYKRFDLAIKACKKLNLPLIVVGKGPDHKRLMSLAGPSIQFEEFVSDEDMPDFFNRARAFILPNVEDFGVIAVEALAAGAPVIAFKLGGAMDYVEDLRNGLFFETQSVDALAKSLTKFSESRFDNQTISKSSQQFDPKHFRDKFTKYVDKVLKQKD